MSKQYMLATTYFDSTVTPWVHRLGCLAQGTEQQGPGLRLFSSLFAPAKTKGLAGKTQAF
jgi:hypothetical protein